MANPGSTPVKSAVIVIGALAFAWAAIELAFKPLLDKSRSSMDKSDPTRDADEVIADAKKSAEEAAAAASDAVKDAVDEATA